MGPLHWSSFFLNSESGFGKDDFDWTWIWSFCAFMFSFWHGWTLYAPLRTSFTFFRESSISCMPYFAGIWSQATLFDGCGCRSKNEKGSPTIPRVFWPESIQLSKAIFLADIHTVSGMKNWTLKFLAKLFIPSNQWPNCDRGVGLQYIFSYLVLGFIHYACIL